MENNSGTNQLIEAARDAARSTDRRKIVQLREIFDEVQEAFKRGATYKIMVAELKKRGLEFTVRSLETTRSRIAKERQRTEIKAIKNEAFGRPTSPRANQNQSKEGNKKPEISPSKKVIAVRDGGKGGDELERPPGISKSAWSELQVKAKAAKRKKLNNSGE